MLVPPSPKLHCHALIVPPLLASVNCTVKGAVPLAGFALKLAINGAVEAFGFSTTVKLEDSAEPPASQISVTV